MATSSGAAAGAPTNGAIPQRSTKQRRAILAELKSSTDFRSAQVIHDDLRQSGASIGLATVYRTLQSLTESEEVDLLRNDSGEVSYRRCRPTHHHHLVCRQCGRAVEIEGPAVEQWADAVAHEHGYRDVSHTLELFGVCFNCS